MNLRKFILDNCTILSIEAFPERDDPNRRVFEAVKMSVCIMNLKRGLTNCRFFLRINSDRFVDESAEKNYLDRDVIETIDKKYLTIPLTSEKETRLLLKILNNTQRFHDVGKCLAGEIDMTLCKSCFTHDSKKARLYKGAIIDRSYIPQVGDQHFWIFQVSRVQKIYDVKTRELKIRHNLSKALPLS
jgi:hypothetical protein